MCTPRSRRLRAALVPSNFFLDSTPLTTLDWNPSLHPTLPTPGWKILCLAWSPRNLAHPPSSMLNTAGCTPWVCETRGRAGSYSSRPLDARPLPIEKLGPLACRDYGRSGSRFAQQEGASVLSGGLRAGPPGSKEGALFELDTCALLRLKGRRARGGGEKRVEETCSARTQEGLS